MKSLLVVAIFLVFVTSSWVSAQGARGNPKDGQVLYQQHCLRCHGEKLDGNGPDGEYLIIRPANFLSQGSRAKTDWELLVTITNGAFSRRLCTAFTDCVHRPIAAGTGAKLSCKPGVASACP